MDIPELLETKQYILRAQSYGDSEGKLMKGDYISVESYPVSSNMSVQKISMDLKKIS